MLTDSLSGVRKREPRKTVWILVRATAGIDTLSTEMPYELKAVVGGLEKHQFSFGHVELEMCI